jgi:hypothetical protein
MNPIIVDEIHFAELGRKRRCRSGVTAAAGAPESQEEEAANDHRI